MHKFVGFRRNFDKNTITSMLQSFILSENSQQQSCSAINYLSNGIKILAGDDPVLVKFWPTSTNPQQEGRSFLKINDFSYVYRQRS